MLLLSNADVARVLTMPMCLEALERLYLELASGDAVGMGRIDLYVPSSQPAPYHRWSVMAGGSKRDGLVCARLMSDMVSWPVVDGRRREEKYAGAPGTYCGLLLLFSSRTGAPVGLIQDGLLQHARVAAGAGLGARYLSRPESAIVGMIGSGGMARAYLEAFCCVRPIRTVRVYSLHAANAQSYAAEMQVRLGVDVEAVGSARDAVRGVDVVACCTSSLDPVFQTAWLEPGMHVTDVNHVQTEADLVDAVDLAFRPGEDTPRVESLPPDAFYARGGFLAHVAGQPEERALVPRQGASPRVLDIPPLTELVAGRAAGRTSATQTTWFLNRGAIGPQFEAVAAAVYNAARSSGVGTHLPDEWFLEDVRD